MKITNPVIGEIEYDESNIITFDEGVLGLPELKRYVIIQGEQIQPFVRLQCLDEPRISFMLLDPAYIDGNFRKHVIKRDPDHVIIDSDEKIVILVVVTVSSEGTDATINMQAPIVINHEKMSGKQVVLIDSPYEVKHSLLGGSGQQTQGGVQNAGGHQEAG